MYSLDRRLFLAHSTNSSRSGSPNDAESFALTPPEPKKYNSTSSIPSLLRHHGQEASNHAATLDHIPVPPQQPPRMSKKRKSTVTSVPQDTHDDDGSLATRISKSCDACKGKKIACQGGKPSCEYCLKHEIACCYSPMKKPGLKAGYGKEFTNRLEFVELQLLNVQSNDMEQMRNRVGHLEQLCSKQATMIEELSERMHLLAVSFARSSSNNSKRGSDIDAHERRANQDSSFPVPLLQPQQISRHEPPMHYSQPPMDEFSSLFRHTVPSAGEGTNMPSPGVFHQPPHSHQDSPQGNLKYEGYINYFSNPSNYVPKDDSVTVETDAQDKEPMNKIMSYTSLFNHFSTQLAPLELKEKESEPEESSSGISVEFAQKMTNSIADIRPPSISSVSDSCKTDSELSFSPNFVNGKSLVHGMNEMHGNTGLTPNFDMENFANLFSGSPATMPDMTPLDNGGSHKTSEQAAGSSRSEFSQKPSTISAVENFEGINEWEF